MRSKYMRAIGAAVVFPRRVAGVYIRRRGDCGVDQGRGEVVVEYMAQHLECHDIHIATTLKHPDNCPTFHAWVMWDAGKIQHVHDGQTFLRKTVRVPVLRCRVNVRALERYHHHPAMRDESTYR